MQEPGALESAMQMMDRFGVTAEFQAGEEMDRTLGLGDAVGFNKWRLIAETIAALSRRSPTISVAQDQPVEAVSLVLTGPALRKRGACHPLSLDALDQVAVSRDRVLTTVSVQETREMNCSNVKGADPGRLDAFRRSVT